MMGQDKLRAQALARGVILSAADKNLEIAIMQISAEKAAKQKNETEKK